LVKTSGSSEGSAAASPNKPAIANNVVIAKINAASTPIANTRRQAGLTRHRRPGPTSSPVAGAGSAPGSGWVSAWGAKVTPRMIGGGSGSGMLDRLDSARSVSSRDKGRGGGGNRSETGSGAGVGNGAIKPRSTWLTVGGAIGIERSAATPDSSAGAGSGTCNTGGLVNEGRSNNPASSPGAAMVRPPTASFRC
jgi:hypothetical protein